MLDSDVDCDLDHASDPWEPHSTMIFNTGGLIILMLGLFPSILVFAEGLAFLGMGMSAGMLFVVFPFAAILAFYTPLEGIPAAVIKGYVTIFIKTIVLAVVSAMVLNVLQFDFMAGSPPLLAIAGIGLVEIFVMAILAKEGLSSVFSTFGLITNSISSVGQNLGVAVGGAAQPFTSQPSTEAMMATAALTGGNPLAMAAMGGASPYMMMGMMGMMGGGRRGGNRSQANGGYSPSLAVRTALRAGREVAIKAGGAVLSAASDGAAAPVAAAVNIATRGMKVINQAQNLREGTGAGNRTVPPQPAEAFSKPNSPLDRYTQEGRERMRAARQKLHQMGPEAEGAGLHIVSASHKMAADWRRQNRHVQDKDGHLNPQFADSVVRNLDRGQLQSFTAAQRDLPEAQRVGLNEAIAIGAARPEEVSQQEIRDSFAEAVRTIGKEESLDEAMQRVSDGKLSAGAAFGDRRRAAEQLVQDFQDRGMTGDRGAQLIRAVHEDLAQNPDLTVEQFRQNHPLQTADPVGGWDHKTGGAEHTDRAVAAAISTAKTGDVTVASIPKVEARAATSPPKARKAPPKAKATSAMSTGPKGKNMEEKK